MLEFQAIIVSCGPSQRDPSGWSYCWRSVDGLSSGISNAYPINDDPYRPIPNGTVVTMTLVGEEFHFWE